MAAIRWQACATETATCRFVDRSAKKRLLK